MKYIGAVMAIAAGVGAYVMTNTYRISKKLGDINSVLLIVLVPSLIALLLRLVGVHIYMKASRKI